jgi:hypothetical protein
VVEAERGLDLGNLVSGQRDDVGFPADATGESGRFVGDSLLAGAAAAGLPALSFESDEGSAEKEVGWWGHEGSFGLSSVIIYNNRQSIKINRQSIFGLPVRCAQEWSKCAKVHPSRCSKYSSDHPALFLRIFMDCLLGCARSMFNAQRLTVDIFLAA